ncbi:MAG TPA: hypothetical protein ENN96_01930 [Candidatus Acetothermia bacterium]|nr:hypothetical protein [Candidatus Acetothermia bacterium]
MTNDAFEILLRDALKAEVEAASDAVFDLEDKVMHRLGERQPRMRWSEWWRLWLAPSRSVRWGQIAVLAATATASLFAGFLLSDRVDTPSSPDAPLLSSASARSDDGTHEVLFVLPALEAEAVLVVGNFNNWKGTPLSDPEGDGIWTTRVNLPPGRYEYAFIIDGRWWGQDPLADATIRSFGEYSSVRYVGRGEDDA